MNRIIVSYALLSLLILTGVAGHVMRVSANNAPFPLQYDPTELTIDTLGVPETTDPAWVYDSASGEFVQNVYETLLTFDRDYTRGPYDAADLNAFAPLLAESLPTIARHEPPLTSPQGLSIYSTWYFKIRTGVQFHSGNLLTPADVEYSFERSLVQDRAGGPTWMLYEPMLHVYYAPTPDEDPNWGLKIDYAVESNNTHVWFNLANQFPQLAFMQILSQPWSSVVEKAWAITEGDLNVASVPSGWSNWQYIWDWWNNPVVSFLEDAINNLTERDGGTGPYEYDYWNYAVDWSVVRNDGGNPDSTPDITPDSSYWDGWPAKVSAGSQQRLAGFVERVTWNYIPSPNTRLTRFLAGDSDMSSVPIIYRDQVLGQSVGGELIRAYWRSPPNGIMALSVTGFYFNFNISMYSVFAGNMKPRGTFGTDGIPPDLFADVNVRKGFAHAFDFDWFLSTVQFNEGEQPSDPTAKGFAYDNIAQAKFDYNLTKAKYYLMLAWGGVDSRSGIPNVPMLPEDPSQVTPGALWIGGMKFYIQYTLGNVARQMVAQEIASKVNSLNPTKFFIELAGLPWGYNLPPWNRACELPIYFVGWLADYSDPHDIVFMFQHSQGFFAEWQAYSNATVDALIEAGTTLPDDTAPYHGELDALNPISQMNNWALSTDPNYYIANPPDTRWPRRSIYYALQELWYEDIPTVLYLQGLTRRFEQAWMRGWYYNALSLGVYAYHVWKAQTHFGDINMDGAVNILDVSTLSSSWSGPPRGPAYFLPQADLTGGVGGTTGSNEGSVKGIPNGKVEIDDLALISAYWDGPPQGPSHP